VDLEPEMRAHRRAQHLRRPARRRSRRAQHPPDADRGAAAQHAADVAGILQTIEIDGVVVDALRKMRLGHRHDRQQPGAVLDAADPVEQPVLEDHRTPRAACEPAGDFRVGEASARRVDLDRLGVASEAPRPGLQQVRALENDDAGPRALARSADQRE
jgi:hypothetical protein